MAKTMGKYKMKIIDTQRLMLIICITSRSHLPDVMLGELQGAEMSPAGLKPF